MLMNIFNFPAEIRFNIYEELLVLSEPIIFKPTWNGFCPQLSLSKRYGLNPALLRTNKRVQAEASPLLYSRNCFGCADLGPDKSAAFTRLDRFFSQIGPQMASFLRHLCIDFPSFIDYQAGSTALHKDSIKILEFIRDNCTSIATLETSLHNTYLLECVDRELGTSRIAAEALDLLDARFKAMPSLNEVVVNIYVYYNRGPSENLRKKMHDCGWTIKITKVADPEYDVWDLREALEYHGNMLDQRRQV